MLKEVASKLIASDNKIESPLQGISIGCPIVIGTTPVQRILVRHPSNATILRRPTKGQTAILFQKIMPAVHSDNTPLLIDKVLEIEGLISTPLKTKAKIQYNQ